MKVFVTGSTGFLGINLVSMLLDDGYEVVALVRKGNKNLESISQVRLNIIEGDILQPITYSRYLHDTDYVINLAGVVTDWAPRSLYHDVHVQGLKRLLEACIGSQVKRVVHISTIDVFKKNNHGDLISELTAISSSKVPYVESKVLGEKIIANFSERLDMVVIRPVWIYGIGDRVFFPDMAYQIMKGQMVLIGSKDIKIPLVHVKNLSRAIISAMINPFIRGESFVISDGEKTLKELTDIIADGLGKKRVNIVIPYMPAFILGAISEYVGRFFRFKRRPLLTRTAVEMLGKSMIIDSSKSKDILSYKPLINLNDGIAEVVDWLRTNDLEKLLKIK